MKLQHLFETEKNINDEINRLSKECLMVNMATGPDDDAIVILTDIPKNLPHDKLAQLCKLSNMPSTTLKDLGFDDAYHVASALFKGQSDLSKVVRLLTWQQYCEQKYDYDEGDFGD